MAAFRKLGGEFLADGFKASWSPDGTRLVFGKQEAPFGDRGDGLAILRLASGKITKLTDSGKDPAWSPGKGRWIAYVDGGYGTNEEVWIVKPSGKKRRKLVDGGYPSWSPDGTEVYYHSRKGRKIMAIKVDVAGAEPKEILASTWWYPVFSPDGNRVAYRSGARLILAECATGKILKEYPMLGGRGFLGNWSPDGKSIGYGGYGHHDTPGLWILDVETGGVRQLSKGFFTMPEWSPDGTKLAVGLRLRDGFQVWMIDAKALPPATAEPNATAITPRFDDPKVQATSRGKLPRCLCSTGRTRQTRHRIPVSFGHVCRSAGPRRPSRGNTQSIVCLA